jgi:outer membrane biosynthesis protein TonB
MKTGLTISALAHAALLLWGLISFSARPLEAAPTDALPVDIISEKQYSELTKGTKNAEKVEETKPPVEKIDEPRPPDDAFAKVAKKQEIRTASEPPPPSPPLPEPRPAKPEKKPPPQVDQIAEALKKEEAKKRAEARAEAKARAKAEQQRQQTKFDPNQIAALLDKRDSQRLAATGEALAPAPASLGVRSGSSAKLSQSELDALRARLMQLWNPPAGVQNPEELIVKIRVQLSRDGRLVGPPMVLTTGRGVMFESARDSAIRALFRGQPFNMLSPSTYELWKEIEITFDPRDMFRG